jgi:type VI secretion system protein ImpA
MLPLTQGKKHSFSYLDWEFLQKPEYASHPRRAEVEETFPVAITETPPGWITAASEVVDECLQEQARLAKLLEQRVEGEAPGLLKMRGALENCQRMARMVLEKIQPARPAEDTKTDIPADGRPASAGTPGSPTTRAEAYRLLAEAAETLERLEPHSPIPYLVRRAVELGSLPFPQLIKALIRDGNVLSELSRELGLKEGESASSD